MKKQKCGFRQKLGIVLAAGMIISNVSFAVLPVSAEEPTTAEQSVPVDMQELINQIDPLPFPDSVAQNETINITEEQFYSIFEQFNLITDAQIESMDEDQKLLYEDAKTKVEAWQDYFAVNSKVKAANETKELSEDENDALVKSVTDYLAAEIKKVVAGTQTSTKFDVSNLIRTSSNIKGAIDEIMEKGQEIIQSLLITCQNDLYWFDKSASQALSFSSSVSGDGTTGTLICMFKVLPEYQDGNEYTVSTQEINSSNTALTKAQEIVNANAGKSDYEKLLAYKNEICELTSYDHDAAKPGYTGSKAPWQMVSVFDGDPNTKVVCEGYSKAFQYLCDLSTFKNAKCYTVSGTMAGGTGAGRHMWNIVSIGSNNYLVDVTNCDEGSVGAPDKLFMAVPSSGEWNGTYVFASASNINYTYNAETISYYGESILKLSTTPYDPTKDPVVDDPTDKPGTDNPDDNKPNKPNRPSKPTTPSKPSSKPGSSSSSSDSGNQTGDNTSTQTTPTTIWAVETSPSDQNNYRLEVRSAIEVPAELAGNDTLNTPQKIESQIRSSLTAKGISNDNIRVYNVALQVYTNGTWQDVSAENFPAEGVTVTVPYPSGTDSTYNFVASHLFTKSMNGFPAGHIETFPESGVITKSSAGISFTVHGLSPISVGWSKAAAGTSTNVSPKTGDQSTILLYMVLMILAAAVMGTVYVKQIRVRKK